MKEANLFFSLNLKLIIIRFISIFAFDKSENKKNLYLIPLNKEIKYC